MKHLAFIFSFVFLSTSFSNIRVGRTGGGLAEMKAYSVVEQLKSIVKICMTSNQSCGMLTWQKEQVSLLNQTLDLGKIQLIAPWSGPSRLVDGFLKINSQDLYESGRPKKFGQILSLVLSILLRDVLKADSSVLNWPYQVFSLFEENMRSLPITNYNLTLHALSLKLPNSSDALIQALAIENEKSTQDISADLLIALSCPAAQWEIESWNYSLPQSWVRAQLTWSCGKEDWYGEMQILMSPIGFSRLNIVRKTRIR